ncbi:hypothetical protein [Rhizobiales bacterium 3FA27D7]|jgi:hypothetical protein|uniref:hypothetical protein n=1 Tax=Mesorhizobium sp. 2RAF21 TaxID=3232995 RepID=UPI0010F5A18A
MDAIYKIMTEANRLRSAAATDRFSADELRKFMNEVADRLIDQAQFVAPKWGELTGLIRDLEKGR